jgi:hypothetical protein
MKIRNIAHILFPHLNADAAFWAFPVQMLRFTRLEIAEISKMPPLAHRRTAAPAAIGKYAMRT